MRAYQRTSARVRTRFATSPEHSTFRYSCFNLQLHGLSRNMYVYYCLFLIALPLKLPDRLKTEHSCFVRVHACEPQSKNDPTHQLSPNDITPVPPPSRYCAIVFCSQYLLFTSGMNHTYPFGRTLVLCVDGICPSTMHLVPNIVSWERATERRSCDTQTLSLDAF